MPTYMTLPKNKIIIGAATEFENTITSAIVTRLENGFDTATIDLPDNQSAFYPDTITANTAIQLTVKDASTSYPANPMFKGVVRFPIVPYGVNELLTLKCDGSGYGLADTVCAQEYGSQSRNASLDTLLEILTDSTYGLIPKYANKILASATNSGFSYDTSEVETITGTVPYLYYPYKPCNKSIDELIDLITAIKAGNAGPHWIVTTDDHLHVKLINGSQSTWVTYYGGSQANSILIQGTDFTEFRFETIGPEANYIIYNGAWRKPSSGDYAENNAADYLPADGNETITNESTIKIVGNYSVKFVNALSGGHIITYPDSKDAAWDFSYFKAPNLPSLNYYLRTTSTISGGMGYNFFLMLETSAGNYFSAILPTTSIPRANDWVHFDFPIGTTSRDTTFAWSINGTPDWSDINWFELWVPTTGNAYFDGLHFGNAQVTRIAQNSTNISTNNVKMKVVTDKIGKDDTLTKGAPGTTDTGLMAQMAYAELLRLQKTCIVGTVTIPMIADALPGQWFHIHAKKKSDGTFSIDKDFRATKITQIISASGYFTTLELTDDLTNSHPRAVYEDRNKIAAATRPDFQDRQASSMKAGEINIDVTALIEDYT